MNPIVDVINVSRIFKRGKLRPGLNRKIFGFFSKKQDPEIMALNNVSFSINKGENVAIIGRNGSGKSTLLRIVSGIIPPSEGRVEVAGSVYYLSGLNQPLKKELSGIENVRLVSSLYGIPQDQFPIFIENVSKFSELGDRMIDPIHSYSDGMIGRLGFSIFAEIIDYLKPEVVIFDEVFSGGGDENFRLKSEQRMKSILSGGTTVLFSTHSLNDLERICEKTIILDKGEIKFIGNTKDARLIYRDMMSSFALTNAKNTQHKS